ncbi:hypothetical protein ACQR1V_03385 [Bradyrhizobium oligotrophicum]|uniref:hypothetical protein n=1 Tax=Bradyrhizobium oligotrophicum TaxID=44255 RepID=UPI003EB86FEE
MKATSRIQTPANSQVERYRRYCKKAEIIHHFAENLAQTLGVFHGINENGLKLAIEGEPVVALGTILFDQLQLMIIRICALCDKGSRDDDASLFELVAGLSDPDFQRFLITKEERWMQSVDRHRTGTIGAIPRYTKKMQIRWSSLQREQEALDRIKHYRNKVLAHATTGLDPGRKVLIKDIWRVSRLVLSVSKYVRLLLEREEWDYLKHSRDAREHGKALIQALHRDHRAQDSIG